jgi:hypothetical protein
MNAASTPWGNCRMPREATIHVSNETTSWKITVADRTRDARSTSPALLPSGSLDEPGAVYMCRAAIGDLVKYTDCEHRRILMDLKIVNPGGS